ncbi:hypothetical protein [Hafnia psychrotolerans]|uniref:Uncharacterized protein n=1 Tax=Hafnia psychrotolerans TaxID=1477018 RepID=A0ABQ1G835_9GAMM|nr:hypothetical protein [Hafnia psychrotolerans]GGA38579.1 hypothetical protein GCM10011328_11780 [Hafnia psychrotolerans]
MDDMTLLTIYDSFHKLADSISASPSTNAAIIISSISGISGVLLGFGVQWYKENASRNETTREASKLIDIELKNILEDAKTAIKASSYLLDNHPNRDATKFLVPTPIQRTFYDNYFFRIALTMEENKRRSIMESYAQMSEYNNDTGFIDNLTNRTQDEILYGYEYLMWLAASAYRHAENSLSEKPSADVDIDHAKLAIELQFECKYLETKRQL